MTKSIHPLDWDSSFFNRRVGRITLNSLDILDELLSSAYQQQYNLVYISSALPISESFINNYSIIDVGGHISYQKQISSGSSVALAHSEDISRYKVDAIEPELLEIALVSGNLSRFNIDPLLPRRSFEALYKTWLENTLKDYPKSAVYLRYLDHNIAGLITSEISDSSTCNIGLLAVSPASRGRGIATSLIKYVEHTAIRANVHSIEVKTQLINTSARALYIKNAFIERDRSYLYHAHIN